MDKERFNDKQMNIHSNNFEKKKNKWEFSMDLTADVFSRQQERSTPGIFLEDRLAIGFVAGAIAFIPPFIWNNLS